MEERSAGAIVYLAGENGNRFLLLKYPAGHWDFPKGNVERGESELQTVIREIREETGLEGVRPIDGFKKKIEYFYRRNGKTVHKEVTFLLVRSEGENVKISFEHRDFRWYSFRHAVERVTYANSKKILIEAQKFLERVEKIREEGAKV